MITESLLQSAIIVTILSAIIIYFGKIISEYRLDRNDKLSYYIDGFLYFLFMVVVPFAIAYLAKDVSSIYAFFINNNYIIFIAFILILIVVSVIFIFKIAFREILFTQNIELNNKKPNPSFFLIISFLLSYFLIIIYITTNFFLFLIFLILFCFIQTIIAIAFSYKNYNKEKITIYTQKMKYTGIFYKNLDNYIEIIQNKKQILINKNYIISIKRGNNKTNLKINTEKNLAK